MKLSATVTAALVLLLAASPAHAVTAPHSEQPGGGEQVLVPAEGMAEAGEAADGEHAPVGVLLEWGCLEQRPAEDCAVPRGYADYLG
ncbi:hypothetical protein A6A08_10615 [Nocardiopsis sp. TSRI0078]|uniref:hypothetical protein n=1 Tax=unclassified Nocardiopsis TaxID=2649073 RepID=UPI00093DF8C4|nr:hypothetical protein A6A08_10615 [Nocardiopsis sp. TSRI0078]